MTRAAAIVASGVVLAAMGACTTVGIGRGDLSGGTANAGGRGPVTFGWKSADGANSGDMDAMLADGRRFTGRFVQLTRERFVQLDPLLVGWPDGWRDWDWGGSDAVLETVYSGQVVANLKGPGTERMRCRFTLNEPSSGMSGGGQGQCQLAAGGTIDAVFPRA